MASAHFCGPYITDRDAEEPEARYADRESRRIFCPAQVYLGAVPLDDACPHHVVGQRLDHTIDTIDTIDTTTVVRGMAWHGMVWHGGFSKDMAGYAKMWAQQANKRTNKTGQAWVFLAARATLSLDGCGTVLCYALRRQNRNLRNWSWSCI